MQGKYYFLNSHGSVTQTTHGLPGTCILLKKEGKWKHLPRDFKNYRQNLILLQIECYQKNV